MIDFPEVKPAYIEYLLCYVYTLDANFALETLCRAQKVHIKDKFALLEVTDKYLFEPLRDFWKSQVRRHIEDFRRIYHGGQTPRQFEVELNNLTALAKGLWRCGNMPAIDDLRQNFFEMAVLSPRINGIADKKFLRIFHDRLLRVTPQIGLDILEAFSHKPGGQVMKVLLETPATFAMLIEDEEFLLKTLGAMRI